MSGPWPMVRLGDVLRRSKEAIEISPAHEYREVTVKLWGKGVELRGIRSGSEISQERRHIARAGQFILSRIDARNGAMGIVPPDLGGAILSNDFPVFEIDRSRLEPGFLGWLARTRRFVERCHEASEGTTNRVRLKEDRFLAIPIPLPPLEEQRRIVRLVEAVARKVSDARALSDQIARRGEALLRALVFSDASSVRTPMGQLVKLREPDVEVRSDEAYQFAGVYSFGRGVFKGEIRLGAEFKYTRLTRLRTGNFVYPKLMAWEGAFGIVPAECHGCVVSTEFPVFEVDRGRVRPEVLDIYFRTPSVWKEIAKLSSGTNVRRRRLNPKTFLQIEVPTPSMDTQERISNAKVKIEAASRLRANSLAQLDALLLSTLHRAFNGEL